MRLSLSFCEHVGPKQLKELPASCGNSCALPLTYGRGFDTAELRDGAGISERDDQLCVGVHVFIHATKIRTS